MTIAIGSLPANLWGLMHALRHYRKSGPIIVLKTSIAPEPSRNEVRGKRHIADAEIGPIGIKSRRDKENMSGPRQLGLAFAARYRSVIRRRGASPKMVMRAGFVNRREPGTLTPECITKSQLPSLRDTTEDKYFGLIAWLRCTRTIFEPAYSQTLSNENSIKCTRPSVSCTLIYLASHDAT